MTTWEHGTHGTARPALAVLIALSALATACYVAAALLVHIAWTGLALAGLAWTQLLVFLDVHLARRSR